MNIKKLSFMILPSILVLALVLVAHFFSNEVAVPSEETKPSVVFLTDGKCEECELQDKEWIAFKKETTFEVEYKRLTTNDPLYSDTVELFGVKFLPAIVTLSPNGEVTYSKSGFHAKEELAKVSSIALEKYDTSKEEKK